MLDGYRVLRQLDSPSEKSHTVSKTRYARVPYHFWERGKWKWRRSIFLFKAEIWEACNLVPKFLICKCDWSSQHCQSYIQKKLVRICYDDQIFVAKELSIHTAQETKKKRLQSCPPARQRSWNAKFFPENIRYLLSDRNLYFSLTKLSNRNCGYNTGIRQLR